jgi:hypothetical protein
MFRREIFGSRSAKKIESKENNSLVHEKKSSSRE